MACGGIHCAGCGAGISVPPVALVYAYGAAWVAEHLAEVAIVSAVCGILAVAAVVALMRWQDRRQARFAAQTTIWTAREVPPHESRMPVRDSGRAAIGAQVVNFNFYGADGTTAARVIRQAIPGTAGTPAPKGTEMGLFSRNSNDGSAWQASMRKASRGSAGAGTHR